ncbi:MAG TPA: hypothetical protein VMU66_05140 [Gaiellales bacterium]|nr:hypothetical protein [Gaiellales bacterium]
MSLRTPSDQRRSSAEPIRSATAAAASRASVDPRTSPRISFATAVLLSARETTPSAPIAAPCSAEVGEAALVSERCLRWADQSQRFERNLAPADLLGKGVRFSRELELGPVAAAEVGSRRSAQEQHDARAAGRHSGQVTSSGSSSTARDNSRTSRLLPIPGTPTSVTSCAARSSHTRASVATRRSSSRLRPTSGVEASRVTSTPNCDRALSASHAGIGSCFPFRHDRRHFAEVEHFGGRAMGLHPDDDPVRRCRRLQPRRDVHDVPGDHRLSLREPRIQRDQRLPL